MNNSKAPKIVVAVGLVAVYGAVFSYVMLRDKPVVDVEQTPAMATAAPMPMVAESTPLPAFDAPLADDSTEVVESPASMVEESGSVTTAPAMVRTREPETAREAVPASEVTDAGEDTSVTLDQPPPSAQATQPIADIDSQITADVRARIETVAPAGSIDVTTTDGVVELKGSVPSVEEIDRVWMAAREVPEVRDVDVSALMVSN